MGPQKGFHFKCKVCKKGLKSKQSLKLHMLIHREGANQCPTCKKRFIQKGNLKLHQRVHSAKRDRLQCPRCPKQFLSDQALRRHLPRHAVRREKCHKCDVCGAGFAEKQYLRNHVNRYHDPKFRNRFQCVFCQKGFPRSFNLKEHILFHIKECPEICKICGKESRFQTGLSSHLKTKHGSEHGKMFRCELCPKTFCLKGRLTSHLRSHLCERPYKCEKTYCQKTFRDQCSLNGHRRLHRDATMRRSHERSQRPKTLNHACSKCEKRFPILSSLQRHFRRVHGKEKNFKCGHCSKAFFAKDDRRSHEERKHNILD